MEMYRVSQPHPTGTHTEKHHLTASYLPLLSLGPTTCLLKQVGLGAGHGGSSPEPWGELPGVWSDQDTEGLWL